MNKNIRITCVKDAKDTNCSTVLTWEEIASKIRNGTNKKAIENIRAEKDKNERRKLKATTLPAALFAGVFVERKDGGLRVPSGVVVMDIDGLADTEASASLLIKDPCVTAFFRSPSGDGLKVFFLIGERSWGEGWNDAGEYLKKHYNLTVDPSGKNVSRLCYFSHDPELHEKTNACEVPKLKKQVVEYIETKKKPTEIRKTTERDASEILSHIPSSPDYETWLKICSGVWNEYGEGVGTALLREWSPEQEDGEYEAKYKHRLQNIQFATVVWVAKQNGYSPKKEIAVITRGTPKKETIEQTTVNDDIMPKVFYNGSHYFYPRKNRKGWAVMDMASVKRQLQKWFIDDEGKVRKDALTEHINDIQTCNYVDYAGSLAGFAVGEFFDDSKLWLVTSESNLLQPKSGQCAEIIDFFNSLLGHDQADIFFQWLQVSWQNFKDFRKGCRFRPAPAIVFCGQKNCGKSLAVDIIGFIFQRTVSGFLWLSGKSDFNGELAGAELITIDDEAGVTDSRLRRQAANKIKSALFSGKISIHPKNKEAITCRPFWRIVFAVNDEPESLQVLPLLDDSMRDKIILFDCSKADIPFISMDLHERWERIKMAIPCFLAWIEAMPKDLTMQGARTGVAEWWHTSILEALGDLSPERRLLDLIEERMVDQLPGYFSVKDIERALKSSDGDVGIESRNLLKHANTCGTYLSRLAVSTPDRVSLHANTGHIKTYFIQKAQK